MNPGVRTATQHDLDLIFAAVDVLEEIAADPEKAQDRSRIYDFSIRWGVLLAGRLHRLEHLERAGELSAEERHGYETLVARLRNAAPVAERLDLTRPTLADE